MKNGVNKYKLMDKKPKSKKGGEIKKNSGPQLKIPNLKKDNFKLPNSFRSQLNEMCGGGYVLLRLDAKRQPVVDTSFDTVADAIALYTYGLSYMSICNELNGNAIDNSIIGNATDGQEQDFDDEDGQTL